MRVDAPPRGSVLALRNPDVPGVVGVIGSLLGDAGINIAHIAWGRDRDHGEAFTLINLDAPVSPELLDTLRNHPKVLWARAVELP
jgi:D-3-phosphoglycerate dehydrogenase